MILKNLDNKNTLELSEEIKKTIDKIDEDNKGTKEQFQFILDNISMDELEYLRQKAKGVKERFYDNRVYMRGLIEFSNYCEQNCLYCGIRKANTNIQRYRLTDAEIDLCVDEGYKLGYRTFVLQSGEDPYYTDEKMVEIISSIKKRYPEVALTISIGERSKESYQKMYDAGANRYLLRHEAASERLYNSLHPKKMSIENRKKCLTDLREIGYQIGAGFMVNSPTQTNADLVEDLLFLQELQPDMCGIGPYLSHSQTPLNNQEDGTIIQTQVCLALVRIIVPKALLPATTALATVDKQGREKMLNTGANVVMPNLSPTDNRKDYEIYENKICLGDEAAQCRVCIEKKINRVGLEVDMNRGDVHNWKEKNV